MDHTYIDRNDVAGRYLRKELDDGDRNTFQAHLVDCQECADRVLLAEMFLKDESETPAAPVVAAVPEPSTPVAIVADRPPLPLRARIVAYLTPWQIATILVGAFLLLLTMFSMLFLWELGQVRGR